MMSFYHIDNPFSTLTVISVLLILNNLCYCLTSEIGNSSFAGFSSAVATWYGSPTGAGSGGACGFENDVAYAPYYGFISAGNQNLFKYGKGCGSCYQVKCTNSPQCSGNPITVTITDECPGACNNEPFHFDLSGKAFGALAKPGQDYALRQLGRITVQYQRVPCFYKASITLKIDRGSNKFYLAFAIEDVNGDGDIGSVVLFSSNGSKLTMQQSFGATWKTGIPSGVTGPYSVQITTLLSGRSIFAKNVIPYNWYPGQYIITNVNF